MRCNHLQGRIDFPPRALGARRLNQGLLCQPKRGAEMDALELERSSRSQTWRDILPTGNTLSRQSWLRRHQVICALLWAHVPGVAIFALVRGETVTHALGEAGMLAGLALAASRRELSDATRSVMATLGLVLSSAVLVHLSGGVIEMHFHFFVVVVVVSLYQSWVPFLVALSFVVMHHGLLGALLPSSVYNHDAAVAGSWKWALVHGGFILAESIACLAAWRLNELALNGERHARVELEKANTDLVTAQRLSSIGSWDWALGEDRVWWSTEMYFIFGHQPGDLVPSLGSFLDQVHPDDRDRVALLVEEAAVGSGGDLDYECRVVRPDGSERIVHALGHRAIGDDGLPVRLLGTVQDITDRKALEEEIEYRAFHDALTGLANRALFMDRVDHALAVRGRSGGPLALLDLDLDDFKTVNDTLGHSIGDEMLVQVAGRLQDSVRTCDTVARLGGDEFALLLESTDHEGATRAAELVLSSLHEPLVLHGAHVLARTSIGIVVVEGPIRTEELIRQADIAMYAAKRQGKHVYRFYQEAMQSSLVSRLGLEAELAEAIERQEFVLHYQPVVDLETSVLTGVEALIRWRHPEHGLLPPGEFISLAEDTGLIVPLGAWVLAESARQVRRFAEEIGQPISVGVNLSAQQLQGDIVGTVRRCLSQAGMDPAQLVVEITETCMMSQEAAVVAKLAELRHQGVRVAVDDFGTGYSSLAYLKRLPIDILKIDRSFVRNITGGPEESALAHAIIKLAGLFGLSTVGEGIETADQAALLRGLGCDRGQGFFFSRPVEAQQLAADVRSGRLRMPASADRVPRHART